MKKTLDVFLRALCTGFAIGIGGAVYLSCDNKYLGAFLFGTGLFTILTFGFNLFTGKVGYAVERTGLHTGTPHRVAWKFRRRCNFSLYAAQYAYLWHC